MDAIGGLTEMPRGGDERQRLEAVAKNLEGVFLRSLLSHARAVDMSDQDGPFARSAAEGQFQELLDARFADDAAGSLGIAEMVVRQLAAQQPAPSAATAAATPASAASAGAQP